MPSSKKKSPSNEDFNFEAARLKLESIVELLGDEETNLANSMKAFEEGIALLREAQQSLSTMEQSVQTLIEQDRRGKLTNSPDQADGQ